MDRDIYITPGDVRRISAFIRREDFYEYRKPSDQRYIEDENDPAWMFFVFREDGSRRVLLKSACGADCIFLAETGCRLPMHIRPLVCRLHPHEYTAGGVHEGFAPGCPVELLEAGTSPDAYMDMDPTELGGWHKLLYEEIILEKQK